MNLNLLQTGLSLETRLSLYLVLALTKKKKFQKIKSGPLLVQYVKGQPDSLKHMSEKRGVSNVTQFMIHPVGSQKC